MKTDTLDFEIIEYDEVETTTMEPTPIPYPQASPPPLTSPPLQQQHQQQVVPSDTIYAMEFPHSLITPHIKRYQFEPHVYGDYKLIFQSSLNYIIHNSINCTFYEKEKLQTLDVQLLFSNLTKEAWTNFCQDIKTHLEKKGITLPFFTEKQRQDVFQKEWRMANKLRLCV
ncbi:hypothetical protein PVL30_002687 [Lodderomyces elongisporus]|uniref:Uncharacterized protein n=1 Tax=Lodderomyces elongisporus (strain ATCC 11503 / CBS 2605 / JCM 1781 / NBRC 1676 / NRRL YB-4239) TaxID=379508 RepID=A5E0Q6_LODEL|nr:uncharacterized protein PVL30_002687 [Lodderomyces elongisporus]EDK45014.1 predicted protein [Lodderomyces elongisporus NRRL YB-4239]WLF78939.1 hypothetical protein PVL30_002687 [Lodderomyces elongisporus]